MLDPEKITRWNRQEYASQTPPGYELAYRGRTKMTEQAKRVLSGYWINYMNEKEARENLLDTKIEDPLYKSLLEWAQKYNIIQYCNLGWLVDNKFIKKSK